MCWAVSSVAPAIEPTADGEEVTTDARIDLAVPESPIFDALGLSPSEVVRPSSPKEFATGILSGIDRNGNFQNGVAIDTAPYLLAFGEEVTLSRYNDSYVTRLLSRTQLSIATSKGSDDEDEAARIGIGARVSVFDLGDPRRDGALMECFRTRLTRKGQQVRALADELEDRAIALAEKGMDPTEILAEQQEALARLDAMTDANAKTCRDEARALNWNRASVTIGVAPSWISEDGGYGDLEFNAATFWFSAGYGFEGVPGLERNSQFIVTAKYSLGEHTPQARAAAGTFEERDALTIAGQLRIAVAEESGEQPELVDDRAPWLILSLEGDYVYADREDLPNDNFYRVSVAGDIKIEAISNTYFSLVVGGTGGRKNGANDGFVIGNFKYGF